MRHPNSPTTRRRDSATTTPTTRGSRFIRSGEKDTYDLANRADLVEYQTVMNYRQR